MATALPWRQIIKTAGVVASLAGGLWSKQGARTKVAADPNADAQSQLAALSQRIDELHSLGAEQAKVVQLLAEEVQGLARRAAIGYRVGIAGCVIAVAAIAVALLR